MKMAEYVLEAEELCVVEVRMIDSKKTTLGIGGG